MRTNTNSESECIILPMAPEILEDPDVRLEKGIKEDTRASSSENHETLPKLEQELNRGNLSTSQLSINESLYSARISHQMTLIQQEIWGKFVHKRRRRYRRILCTFSLFSFILICCIVIGVLYYKNLVKKKEYLPTSSSLIDKLANGTYEQWQTDGRGLKLIVQHALTDDWYGYFQKAVQDWDAAPALILDIVNSTTSDPSCTPARGALKVCNSNYGATNWLGLTESVIINNYIRASVSKMNEYYLAKSSDALKQYTMCHEMGHGFGLPHRDENFNNADMRTCLDYSRRPENNMHPNQADFDHLSQLYLFNNRSRMLEPMGPTHTLGLSEPHGLGNLNAAIKSTESRSYRNGRLLRKSKYNEVWETILSEQVRIQTSVLLAL